MGDNREPVNENDIPEALQQPDFENVLADTNKKKLPKILDSFIIRKNRKYYF